LIDARPHDDCTELNDGFQSILGLSPSKRRAAVVARVPPSAPNGQPNSCHNGRYRGRGSKQSGGWKAMQTQILTLFLYCSARRPFYQPSYWLWSSGSGFHIQLI